MRSSEKVFLNITFFLAGASPVRSVRLDAYGSI